MQWQLECGSMAMVLTAQLWGRQGGGSTPAAAGLVAAVAVWQHCGISSLAGAALPSAHHRGGNEDTGGDSNGRGTDNNQQSTECIDGNSNEDDN
jgi:hypothetical protein